MPAEPPASLLFRCAVPAFAARSAADDQIYRFGALALLVRLDVEADALPLVERFQARTLDRGDVHEHVATAVVRLDETVAALAVEEVDRTAHGHREAPFPNALRRRPPRRGGSAGHSQTGKGIGREGLSHLRRPPMEAERRSQQLGSKPTPSRWKEANAASFHFSR